MNERSPHHLDEARILPRLRPQDGPQLERSRLLRSQAAVLSSAIASDPQGRPVPQRANATAGELRGIPAIGRGVAGVSPGTSPETAIGRVDRDRERRAKTEGPVEPMVAYA